MNPYFKIVELLNGRKIGEEITPEIKKMAIENDLIIIYGASDDLAEIDGAIYDEVGVSDGGLIYFDEEDLFRTECEDKNCPHEIRRQEKCKTVEAVWCEGNISWTYKTDIPHKTFDILEDGEVFCRGIVFYKRYLK